MKKIIFFITTFFFCINISYTQPGKLDPAFGTNGIVKTNIGSNYDYPINMKQIVLRPDGDMHLIFERNAQTRITKRHENGERDTTFGENGFASAVNIKEPHAIIQSDSKVVIAGTTSQTRSSNFAVARFNTDGSIDKTFSNGLQTTRFNSESYATAAAIQDDGKIVVTGYTSTLDSSGQSSFDFALARYNTDGTPDKSFSDDGVLISSQSNGDDIPTSIVVQKDGKIAVVGYSNINNQNENHSFAAIARYNTDGSIDTSFTVDANRMPFLFAYPNSAAIQTDGKIVITGQSVTGVPGLTVTDIFVARYNTDGSLDKTFNHQGWQSADFGSDNENARMVKLQSDGKIVVLGTASNGSNIDFALARYKTDGSPDTTFGTNGLQQTDFENGEEAASLVYIKSDGKIVVAGSTIDNTFLALAHYNADGSPDSSFYNDGTFSTPFKSAPQGFSRYSATAIQSDGKMVAAGRTWNGNNTDFAVVRYNTDGSLDSTFSNDGVQITDLGDFKDGVLAVAIQSDGKIVAGGYSSDQVGSHFAIARYNTDGSLDSSFGGDGTPPSDLSEIGNANALAIQSDGKILLAGNLWNGSNSDFGVVRYNTNGQRDSTFGSNGIVKTNFGSTEDDARAMAIQKDGKIVVGGVSYAFANTHFVIVRYNIDGSLDTTFKGENAKAGDNDLLNALAIQRDGKIIVGGSAYSFYDFNNSNSNFALLRFNANGSLDHTFSGDGVTLIDMSPEDRMSSLVLQRNGKIIAGGISNNTFTLVRLKTDGSVDSSFSNNGIETTRASISFNAIRAMAIANNRLYVAGVGEYPGDFAVAARYLLDDTSVAPIVRITAPGRDTSYSAPARIKLKAIATDEDGEIIKVQFYNGTTRLHTETAFPYGFLWVDVPAGNYTFTAKATDDSSMVTTSAAVKVSVVAHSAPTVSLTNPANNEIFAGPATIRLRAAANDPEGTVSKVEFYNGDTLLSTVHNYPYTYTWKDVPLGKYKLTAKAINNFGLVTTSLVTKISVVPNKAPAVAITNLANYQRFTAPATIPLIAFAKDPDGTISKVEFYRGTALLHTEYIGPYTHTMKDLPAGTYTITAKAIDNLGLSKTSAPVTIVVTAADTPIVSNRKPLVNDLTQVNKGVSIKLWPNPAGNTLNIYSDGLVQNKQTNLSVISVSGVVMKTIQLYSVNQTIQLDVSSLASGVYTIKFICGDKVMYKQFIKL